MNDFYTVYTNLYSAAVSQLVLLLMMYMISSVQQPASTVQTCVVTVLCSDGRDLGG